MPKYRTFTDSLVDAAFAVALVGSGFLSVVGPTRQMRLYAGVVALLLIIVLFITRLLNQTEPLEQKDDQCL